MIGQNNFKDERRTMKTIAIITARGGSKRIPRKNIKDFLGKPIIAYSIEAALESGVFDEVMVSTDDEEIADIARKYGAKVPFMRSEATSNDFASTDEVIAEVIDRYSEQGKDFDALCCIYPTAPFITGRRLKEAVSLLEEHESVTPVTQFSYPPQRGFIIENGVLRRKYPEFATARSQDLEKLYHDSGQFYACRVDAFLRDRTTDVDDMAPVILSDDEVQDIDTMDDWRIAEEKYRRLKAKSESGHREKTEMYDDKALKTPYYRIDECALNADIAMLKEALSKNWSNSNCSYSVKTNSLPWLLTHFKNNGFYAEVVSKEEYDLSIRLGFDSDKIIYNGPIKDRSVFESVLLAGGVLNMDSSYEPKWLKELAEKWPEKVFNIGIRVNYNLSELNPDEVLADDEGSRFGYCYENGELEKVINKIKTINNVNIAGLHLHSSTKTRSVGAYRTLSKVAVIVAKEFDLDLKYIDMGGGYYGGVPGKPTFKDYIPAMAEELSKFFDKDKTTLIVEPGVSMVSSSFSFVTSVVDTKDIRGKRYVIIDGSRVNLNPQVTRRWYPHKFELLEDSNRQNGVLDKQEICGSTCMEYDRLFEAEGEQELVTGDRVIFTNAGGYTVSLTPLFIHYFPAVYVKKQDGTLFTARAPWNNDEYIMKNFFE